jgi:protein-tyrosine phosphatase
LKHGRIDVHAHLLPGIDDGCSNLEQSLECARILVESGYTHAFCTPHIWPNLNHYNRPEEIRQRTDQLQDHLAANGVPLKLFPGGELNLRPEILFTAPEQIITYGLAGKFCIFDM